MNFQKKLKVVLTNPNQYMHMKNPKTDPMDYDGMGDFSRYRNAETGHKSLENTIRDWLKKYLTAGKNQ